MSVSATESIPWTPRRWGWTIGVLLACQVLLLWLMANRQPDTPRKPGSVAHLRMLSGTVLDKKLAAQLAVSDPTLFALVSANGFSGAAWTNHPWANHQLMEWNEEPRWMAPRQNKLGSSFGGPTRPFAATGAGLVDKPLPPLAEVAVVRQPLVTNALLRIEGNLAGRPLLTPRSLPVQPCNDLLTNSEVRVMVDADGRTFSATLLQSSGLPSADQRALELARTARFQPLPAAGGDLDWSSARLTWGKLIFPWCCTEIIPTNSAGQRP